MKQLKWLASLPFDGLEPADIASLIVGFWNNDVTIEMLTAEHQRKEVAHLIGQILGWNPTEARKLAYAISKHMQDLMVNEMSPPSADELESYIQAKRLRLQPRQVMQSIYSALTTDDPKLLAIVPDPTQNGQPFNPVLLRLALERVFGFTNPT